MPAAASAPTCRWSPRAPPRRPRVGRRTGAGSARADGRRRPRPGRAVAAAAGASPRGRPACRTYASVRSLSSGGGFSRTHRRTDCGSAADALELHGAGAAIGHMAGQDRRLGGVAGHQPLEPARLRGRLSRVPLTPRDPSSPIRPDASLPPAATGRGADPGPGPYPVSRTPRSRAAPPGPRLDRAERPAGPPGDLRLRQPLAVRQHDDRPLGLGHPVERVAQQRALLVSPLAPLRPRAQVRATDHRRPPTARSSPPRESSSSSTAATPDWGAVRPREGGRRPGCGRSLEPRGERTRRADRTARPGSTAPGTSPAPPPRRPRGLGQPHRRREHPVDMTVVEGRQRILEPRATSRTSAVSSVRRTSVIDTVLRSARFHGEDRRGRRSRRSSWSSRSCWATRTRGPRTAPGTTSSSGCISPAIERDLRRDSLPDLRADPGSGRVSSYPRRSRCRRCHQLPAGRWRRPSSVPAGTCASRHVTPCGPTSASWRVPAGSSRRSPTRELGRGSRVRQAEPDGPAFAHEDLVVPVLVGSVVVVRPVGPGTGSSPAAAAARRDRPSSAHPADRRRR